MGHLITGDIEPDAAMPLRPSLSFASITFSDGTSLSLDDDDIVVFVGPNNSGKSAALRELEAWLARSAPGVVISSASIKKTGTSSDLKIYLEQHALKSGAQGQELYGGINYNIHHSHLQFFDHSNRDPVAPFFVKRIATETRIQASNAAPGIALHLEPPTNPIHLLMMYPALASDISSKFRHAFGADLTPFRAGGSSFPLFVGDRPTLKAGQDELSHEFVRDLQSTNVLLETQGDGMRSFASILLHVLLANTLSVQLLDEPEAFLHPPQARLLGRYIAGNRRNKSQLFIATHSSDILDGLIEGGSNKVRIVRLRRDDTVNRVRELDKDCTKALSNDTLIRYSRVFEGIFFDHVIVCEADADCLFYQSVLNLPSISGDRRPDVLFVHTAGKHRMAKLARTLRALDVPVSIIADIDILNEENTFKQLVESVEGDWSVIRPHWKAISDVVLAQRPQLNASQVAEMINRELADVGGSDEFPSVKEAAIKRIFKTVSPWTALKQSGRRAIPGGEPTKQFDQLNSLCAAIGLWIVPVGEVEGFCRSIGSHGPGFVEKVIEEKDLETDVELQEARDFIDKIWKRARPKAAKSEN